MQQFTIGEIARRTGHRPSTLRYYESINLLPAPLRVSGQRRYHEDILDRLSFIQSAQRLGFSLTEIQQLLNTPAGCIPLSENWQAMARQKLKEINQFIQHAQDIRQQLELGLGCDCSTLDSCIECLTGLYQP